MASLTGRPQADPGVTLSVARHADLAHRRPGVVLAYTGVAAAWMLSVSLSSVIRPPALLHDLAVDAHILALVLGFGAVMVVDWYGLLWLLGRRGLHESTRLAAAASRSSGRE